MAQKLIKFCPSGEISPNLVTLLTSQVKRSRADLSLDRGRLKLKRPLIHLYWTFTLLKGSIIPRRCGETKGHGFKAPSETLTSVKKTFWLEQKKVVSKAFNFVLWNNLSWDKLAWITMRRRIHLIWTNPGLFLVIVANFKQHFEVKTPIIRSRRQAWWTLGRPPTHLVDHQPKHLSISIIWLIIARASTYPVLRLPAYFPLWWVFLARTKTLVIWNRWLSVQWKAFTKGHRLRKLLLLKVKVILRSIGIDGTSLDNTIPGTCGLVG